MTTPRLIRRRRRIGIGITTLTVLVVAAASLLPRAVGAQPKVVSTVATVLELCSSVPDESACRSVLRQRRATPTQRSIALVYLAEIVGYGDSLLLAAIEADPANALAHYQLGKLYGGTPTGFRHLRAALALRPDWTHIHRRVAETYRPDEHLQHHESPVELWRIAATFEPKASEVLAAFGTALLNSSQLTEAESVFRRADSIEANVPQIVHGLCKALLRQKRFDRAADPCRRTITGWEREHGGDLREISSLAEEQGAYDIALAAVQQGRLENPDSLELLRDWRNVLYAMGRDIEADSLLIAYTREHSQDWSTIDEAASRMAARGRLQLAYDLYHRLVTRKCHREDITCTATGALAVTALRLNRTDEAFARLDSALVQQPDCPQLINDFRRYAAASADSAATLPRLDRALERFGAYISALGRARQAADFFASVGRWDRAAGFYKTALDSAVALDAGEPLRFSRGLRWEYGRALVEAGRYCEGLRVLTEARKEEPERGSGQDNPLRVALGRAQQQCRESQ